MAQRKSSGSRKLLEKRIWMQTSALIQPRTSPRKFGLPAVGYWDTWDTGIIAPPLHALLRCKDNQHRNPSANFRDHLSVSARIAHDPSVLLWKKPEGALTTKFIAKINLHQRKCRFRWNFACFDCPCHSFTECIPRENTF